MSRSPSASSPSADTPTTRAEQYAGPDVKSGPPAAHEGAQVGRTAFYLNGTRARCSLCRAHCGARAARGITIGSTGVPVTLQTRQILGIMLTGGILAARNGFLAVTVLLLFGNRPFPRLQLFDSSRQFSPEGE